MTAADLASGIAKLLSILSWLVKEAWEIGVHIRAKTIVIEGANNPIPIVKGRDVILPKDVKSCTIHGSYLFSPGSGHYALFILKEGKFWPQADLNIAGRFEWTAPLRSSSLGKRRILIVKMSPEIQKIRQVYFDTNNAIDNSRQEMKDAGVSPVDLKLYVGSWAPLTELDRLPTFKIVDQFDLTVEGE